MNHLLMPLSLVIVGTIVTVGQTSTPERLSTFDSAQAATDAGRPTFEVASIKRNLDGPGHADTTNLPGGRVAFTNRTLREIIRSANGSIDIEVIGGPDWLYNDRWNIVAAAPKGSVVDVPVQDMLKSLLEDRFKLRSHTEQRQRPIYAMIFARTDKRLGPRIRLTACSGPRCGGTSGNTQGIVSGTLTRQANTMEQIGRSLSR